MPEDKQAEPSSEAATEQIAPTQVAPSTQPSGKWHASRAVLIVLGVLSAIVVAGLGFTAGYAVGGHGDHPRRGDWHGPAMMRDHLGPPQFRGEMRIPFERGELPAAPQQSAPTTPAAPTP